MKLEHDGKKDGFTGYGFAIGKKGRSMSPRFGFAVGEALRRELLDGRFGFAPEGRAKR